ncbi:MAG: fibronectin type III domain-containing protein, partial [Eubacterium sp.]|nr:fibronectin type III domain-containing protein [Eubacterium sp.]
MFKKSVSILIAVLMMFSVLSAAPFTFAADTNVKTVNIKSEKDLFDRINKGHSGASFTSGAYGEAKTFTFTLQKECYAFFNIYSYKDDMSDYVSQEITVVSTNPVDEIFSHFSYDKAAESYNRLEQLNAGTYRIQIKENNSKGTHTSINIGILAKDTDFLSASYVKTVKNSSNQSMVLKINTLDSVREIYADNSNYGYVSGVKTVGEQYKLDSDNCITVPVESYNGKTYPYFTILTEDVYGISHEYWLGVIAEGTAQFSGIKNKVYTGKNITQKFTVSCFNDAPTYKVTYSNNLKVGKAKVTITGFGRWSGSVTKTFKINPGGTALGTVSPGKKKMTVRWKKQATETTGYEIQYGLKKSFKKAKTVRIKKNTTLAKTIKKLKSKKTYYVRVRTYQI